MLALLLGGFAPASATEEPAFELVEQSDTFEIRRYAPFVVAEVRVDESLEEAGNKAFSTLFQYISGANRGAQSIEMTAPVVQSSSGGESIEMTAPVSQRQAGATNAYWVSFVLPERFDLESAPPPTDTRVQLRAIPPRLMAVVRYSGFWSERGYRKHERILMDAIASRGYEAVAAPEWARYNAPLTPWFLRRNEVMVEVRRTETSM